MTYNPRLVSLADLCEKERARPSAKKNRFNAPDDEALAVWKEEEVERMKKEHLDKQPEEMNFGLWNYAYVDEEPEEENLGLWTDGYAKRVCKAEERKHADVNAKERAKKTMKRLSPGFF